MPLNRELNRLRLTVRNTVPVSRLLSGSLLCRGGRLDLAEKSVIGQVARVTDVQCSGREHRLRLPQVWPRQALRRETGRQTGKQAGRQAGRQAGGQAGHLVRHYR